MVLLKAQTQRKKEQGQVQVASPVLLRSLRPVPLSPGVAPEAEVALLVPEVVAESRVAPQALTCQRCPDLLDQYYVAVQPWRDSSR